MNKIVRELSHDATFWLVLIFISASAIAAYVLAVDLGQKVRTADLSAAARAQSELLTATRSFYSREVVDKLYSSDDVTVSHDFHDKELTVPAPVSMTLALEDELRDTGAESGIRMLSDYPWPWRKDRQLDSFETEALVAIQQDPNTPFERLEDTDEGSVFRSAIAVKMEGSCVACHNTHEASPKTDWDIGDIRGIQAVSIPASSFYGSGLGETNNLVFLLIVAFSAALCLTYVLSKQRKKAVQRVADLAAMERDKNAALQSAIHRAEVGEAQVGAILDTMRDGLLTISADGKIQNVNRSALVMFGASSPGHLKGKSIIEILPEIAVLNLPFACCTGERSAPMSKDGRFETTGKRIGGETYPVEMSLSESPTEETNNYTAIFRDLSNQKLAEQKLRQAETRLIDAIESLPDGFVLYDSDDRLVVCNKKYREFYARSADLIQPGKTFESIIREGANRGQYQVSKNELEGWIAARMDHHFNPGTPMEQHLDDGRWLRVIESRTSEGGLVGFRVDITELKQREEELRRSEDLLRNVVDASFDGVIVMDGNGTVVDFSPAAEDVFGWSSQDVVGQKMSSMIIPQQYREAHDTGLQKFIQTGEGPVLGKRFEIEGLHKDGHEIIVELAIRHTEGANGPLFLGYVRDVTERKAADAALREAKEKAEAANEAKAKFLAMMSHEIRTPMNGILGILSLLRDTDLDPGQAAYLQTARDSGRSLLALINDILDFSKLEAGRMELELAPFRLKSVVRSVVDLFQPIAQDKGLNLTLHYPDTVPHNVVGDAGRLRQVVLNLVSNAVKFTELGSVDISVSLDKDDTYKPTFRFSVKDTGIGIPESRQDEMFGDFVTVDSSYTKKHGGTGLGLAICRQIAATMDGEVQLESLPGAGSTFHFVVPIELSGDPVPQSPSGQDLGDITLPDGVTILLAEDNATNQIVVSHALQQAGCDIDIANNGKEAVKAAQHRDYHCILMDISMPEMDGLEATKLIQQGVRNAKTPIIALTAYSLRGDRERFLASGMSDFLSKPVEKEDLLICIAQNLKLNLKKNDETATHQLQTAGALSAAREILSTMPPDLQCKLLQQFIEDTRKRQGMALEAVEQDDLENLERATHALKSVASTFGASDLTAIASEINLLAQNNNAMAAMAKVDELQQTCERTLGQVKALAQEIGLNAGFEN